MGRPNLGKGQQKGDREMRRIQMKTTHLSLFRKWNIVDIPSSHGGAVICGSPNLEESWRIQRRLCVFGEQLEGGMEMKEVE